MNPITGLPKSLCGNCGTPLRDCPYLLNSKLNEPAFIPGSEHIERDLYGADRTIEKLYIITKCPLFTKDETCKQKEAAPLGGRKLSKEEAVRFFNQFKEGMTAKELAREYGISRHSAYKRISKIRKMAEMEGQIDE